MGIFRKSQQSQQRQQSADCRTCDGSGRVQTGSNKWTGATFSTCPACGGTGAR